MTVDVDATLHVEVSPGVLAPLKVADDSASPTGKALPVLDAEARASLDDMVAAVVDAATEETLLDVLVETAATATELGPTNETAPASDTATSAVNGRLQRLAQRLSTLIGRVPPQAGTWDYRAGSSGTVVIPADGKVLQITAIALGGAGSLVINAGQTIPIPYDATDKVSSELGIGPKGNLVAPTLVFTDTDAYFVEFVV